MSGAPLPADRAARPPGDRMAEWGNDDLLIRETTRIRLEADFPGFLRVVDIPELRRVFETFDGVANLSRKRRQRDGLVAVAIAGAGATLSAVLPLVEPLGGTVAHWVFAFSAALSVFGLLWAITLSLSDRYKAAWLQHRLRTERLRQFYFQLLLSDPELATRAVTDDAALAEWRDRLQRPLKAFEAWLAEPMRSELSAVIDDVNQRFAWQMEGWKQPRTLSGAVDLDAYLAMLRRRRIGVQLNYVREKLAPGVQSPATRLAAVQISSWVLTFAIAFLTIATAIVLFQQPQGAGSVTVRILSSVTALLGVLSIFIRVTAEGLQLKGDVERYSWYRDAIEDLDGRFNDRDPTARLDILREMEALSYRELREFLKLHQEARFSFG